MVHIAGYTIEKLLITEGPTNVFLGMRSRDQEPVLIKTAPVGAQDTDQRFPREFGLLRKLRSRGVIQVLDLLRHEDDHCLVYRRPTGITLKDYLGQHQVETAAFLEIALQLAHALADIHKSGVIHKNIKPLNILIDPKSLVITIAGFDMATPAQDEMKKLYRPEVFKRSLHYTSPEQTGRMERGIDFRSDLYSLGVSLYELTTGELPFFAEPLELIHMHLAVNPKPPHVLNKDLPEQISRMIRKLMEKDPDKRYQTAGGLHADLLTAKALVHKGQQMEWFELGSREVPTTLLLPRKIYGRKSELRVLQKAYREAYRGSSKLVIISGPPGVGKTSLVQALRKSLLNDRIPFLEGEFNQAETHTAYAGFAQALNSWLEKLLAGSDEDLNQWRERLRVALEGGDAEIMRVIPKLALVLEKTAPNLAQKSEGDRIGPALKTLLTTIANKVALMLSLDDVQWADPASLSLVADLVTVNPPISLLLILSHREVEGATNYPICDFLTRLKEEGLPFAKIELKPWSSNELNEFLAETVDRSPVETRRLAELIERKTGGNPQFVRQYLRHAYKLRLIYYEVGAGWNWDMEAIESAGIPDDIVGIMTEKIINLPERTLHVLKLAACIGRRFDLSTLCAVAEMAQPEVLLDLYALTFEGLISPHGDVYRFSHERIYEASLGLTTEEEEARLHYHIGQLKLAKSDEGEIERDLFSIVSHLNHGIVFIKGKERLNLARLNLRAARAAVKAGRLAEAKTYLTAGLTLADATTWEKDYDLMFGLNLGQAKSTFLMGDYSRATDQFRALLECELTQIHYARVVAHLISVYNLTGQPIRGLREGVNGLAKLGGPIPIRVSKWQLYLQYLATQLAFFRCRGKKLVSLKETGDPQFLARMRILVEMVNPAYTSSARYTSYLILYMAKQVFSRGHQVYSPLALTLFNALMTRTQSSIKESIAFSEMMMILQKRYGYSQFNYRVMFYLNAFVRPWFIPYRDCATALAGTAKEAEKIGDSQFSAYATVFYWTYRFMSDGYLGELIEEAQKVNAQGDLWGVAEFKAGGSCLERVATYLHSDKMRRAIEKENSKDPFHLNQLRDRHFRMPFFFCAPHVACALYLFGRYKEAFELVELTSKTVVKATLGGQSETENTLFYGLSAAALFPDAPAERRTYFLSVIDRALMFFKKWSAKADENFSVRYHLLEAERARITGNPAQAFHFYATASQKAAQEAFLCLRGLIEERRATLSIAEGLPLDASNFIHSSLTAYKSWGARAKAAQVRALYGTFLRDPSDSENRLEAAHKERASEVMDKGLLDLETVLQSSLAISQEVRLGKVLERVMGCTMENAGARRGVLLLKTTDELWIEGESSVDGRFSRVAHEKPVDEGSPIPLSIITYAKRTLKPLVLGDASREGLFKKDPYVVATHARSVLVLPIVQQNKLIGLLYLENNLVSNAFSEDRIEILRTITAQAAISIENASLYDEREQLARDLEDRVDERTLELQQANKQLTQEIEDRIKTQKELVEVQGALLESARRAGMTEVAIGVLHNVGNVLNSITISVATLAEHLNNSKLNQLGRVVGIFKDPEIDLAHFFTKDPKGKILPEFMEKLAERLGKEQDKAQKEVARMTSHVSHAIEVIRAQQDQAKMVAVLEPIEPSELLEDAIRISGLGLPERKVSIHREYEEMPSFLVEKHKVLQILVNLIKNAGQAMAETGRPSILTVGLKLGAAGKVVFSITDNGMGIDNKLVTEIFSYGFTTHKDGHGFGLHNAANAATEMGGSLKVFSDGVDKGATFVMVLPLRENTKGRAMDVGHINA